MGVSINKYFMLKELKSDIKHEKNFDPIFKNISIKLIKNLFIFILDQFASLALVSEIFILEFQLI